MKKIYYVLLVLGMVISLLGCAAPSNEAFTTPMIVASDTQSFALKSDGTVWAWGDNQHGFLGVGNLPWNYHNEGQWMWIYDEDDDLTIGIPPGSHPEERISSPVQVEGLNNIISIAPFIALRDDGTVWTWGFRHDGATMKQGLENIIAVARDMALREDGTVWTWGTNGYGELGIGTVDDWDKIHPPTRVEALDSIIAIASGNGHRAALRDDGTVWSWGLNGGGQLGNGTGGWPGGYDYGPDFYPSPVQAYGLDGVVAIVAGSCYTVALREDGTVWAWGDNGIAQLGDGTIGRYDIEPEEEFRAKPVQAQISNIIAIAAGEMHTVVLREDGTVWGWGWGVAGQLGDGLSGNDNLYRIAPVQALEIDNIVAIAAGSRHTLAMREDGTVWAWGCNSRSQLGDGTFSAWMDDQPIPQQVVSPDSEGYFNLKTLYPVL